MGKIGIIGGSGLYGIAGLEFIEEKAIDTRYGNPSDSYLHYKHKGTSLYFLCRHSRAHNIAPHKINYRANIEGFAQLGVEKIVSFSATGGIADWLKPGDIVLPDNAIDHTHSRIGTFHDEEEIVHIDFTHPFCQNLRETLIKIMNNSFTLYKNKGVHIATNGPRLETAAEIKAFRQMGADLVGMTLFPECALARERGICYANISVITNYAAGIKPVPLTTDEVVQVMTDSAPILAKIITGIASAEFMGECTCRNSLQNTKINRK